LSGTRQRLQLRTEMKETCVTTRLNNVHKYVNQVGHHDEVGVCAWIIISGLGSPMKRIERSIRSLGEWKSSLWSLRFHLLKLIWQCLSFTIAIEMRNSQAKTRVTNVFRVGSAHNRTP
jgi:hypothetical protein